MPNFLFSMVTYRGNTEDIFENKLHLDGHGVIAQNETR